MPAHINYETTPIIFYKFVCENPEIKSCYVGHTSNFMNRRRQHKYCCTNITSSQYEHKKYQIIRDNGGLDNWKMVEINRRICLDKIDCIKIEQQYIEKLQTDMNMINAYCNKADYNKTYRLENSEKLATYNKQHKLENKEHRREQNKIYRLKNLEKIATRATQKFDCECGGKYTYNAKSLHLKTLKHLKYCESIVKI